MNTVASTPPPQFDALLAVEKFPLRGIFHPLGFAVEIETNSSEILLAAQESWGEHTSLGGAAQSYEVLRLRIGVTPCAAAECPPAVSVRAFGHLLSIVADAENFVVCDLQQGLAFGWINEACLCHRGYFRYHFLEAAVMCLLVGTRATPIHAACVSHNGRGMLLCGESGAGKSTLAYACARAGFAYTTDDTSYLVWPGEAPRVRGNAHQVRFRPSARELFPELRGLSVTPRAAGKPSIEVRTSELPGIMKAPEVAVHTVVLLCRHEDAEMELVPLPQGQAMPHLEATLFPMNGIRERQALPLRILRDIPAYELHYRDLDTAVARLQQLCRE